MPGIRGKAKFVCRSIISYEYVDLSVTLAPGCLTIGVFCEAYR